MVGDRLVRGARVVRRTFRFVAAEPTVLAFPAVGTTVAACWIALFVVVDVHGALLGVVQSLGVQAATLLADLAWLCALVVGTLTVRNAAAGGVVHYASRPPGQQAVAQSARAVARALPALAIWSAVVVGFYVHVLLSVAYRGAHLRRDTFRVAPTARTLTFFGLAEVVVANRSVRASVDAGRDRCVEMWSEDGLSPGTGELFAVVVGPTALLGSLGGLLLAVGATALGAIAVAVAATVLTLCWLSRWVVVGVAYADLESGVRHPAFADADLAAWG